MSFSALSQTIFPFKENNKWGYKKNGLVIIKPTYDTAFTFDRSDLVAMVGNVDHSKKTINPLTGEEIQEIEYCFIKPDNRKINIKANDVSDSVNTFSYQYELQLNYVDSSKYFKILFQNKSYLCLKSGKQVSKGYNNITTTKYKWLFETESFIEFESKFEKIKGLIDTTGFEIAECKYHKVNINMEDSVVYCCSSIFNKKLNDVVLDFKGKNIYSSINHIEFASKSVRILKSFYPREEYILENVSRNDLFYFEGDKLYYINNNSVLIIKKDDWYILDLITRKKRKTDNVTFIKLLSKIGFN